MCLDCQIFWPFLKLVATTSWAAPVLRLREGTWYGCVHLSTSNPWRATWMLHLSFWPWQALSQHGDLALLKCSFQWENCDKPWDSPLGSALVTPLQTAPRPEHCHIPSYQLQNDRRFAVKSRGRFLVPLLQVELACSSVHPKIWWVQTSKQTHNFCHWTVAIQGVWRPLPCWHINQNAPWTMGKTATKWTIGRPPNYGTPTKIQ